MDPLVAYSSANHPLAQQIFKEYNLQTIKIMKVKYGWPADSNGPLFTLACRIVKMNLPDLINDIKVLVKTDSRSSTEIIIYTCYELVRIGNVDKAIEFVNSLEEEQCKHCCANTVGIASDLFSEEIQPSNQNCINNFMEFFKYTKKYLNAENKTVVDELQRIQNLKQNLNISITLNDLRDKNMKCIRLHESVKNFAHQLQMETKTSTSIIVKVWNNCLLLARSFDFNEIYTIIEVLKELQNLQLSCEIAKLVLQLKSISSGDFQYYVKFAVLLIVQEINSNETSNAILFTLFFSIYIQNFYCV